MIMNRVKSCKQLLIIFTAIFITDGYYGQELQKTSGKILKEGVINIITTLHGVMKQYKSDHTIFNPGMILLGKGDLARKCRQTKDLPLNEQANAIMKILQEFVGDLQQMQIDEMTFQDKEQQQGGQEVTRALRTLEYDLRDLIETKLRNFITEYIGHVTVPYSLGSLPSLPTGGRKDLTASMHYFKLEMLRVCISDMGCMERWMHLMNDNSTKEMLGPNIC